VTDIPAAELWRRVALVSGIDATYGAPYGALEVVPMSGAVTTLCAAAHQKVHGARAAAHRGDGVFWLPGSGRERCRTIEADSAEALVAAVPVLSSAGEIEIRFTLDPDQPVESFVPPPPAPGDNWVEPAEDTVEAMGGASDLVLLAGPGVVAHGSVPGLHDLAVSAGVGVLNTWGAKGVFDWRSRHHLATIGLQADDFVLSGLDQADLIIATGLDHAESPDDRWRLAPALTIPPAGLAPLAERIDHTVRVPLTMPPLRARLAEVTQRGWAAATQPLAPSRATMHYAEQVAGGALVAADAGAAGFWVARTLGTTRLGAVIVPSTSSPGFAAACVAVSLLRHPGRRALAVIDLAQSEATAEVAAAAATLGIRVPVEAWDPDGARLDADAHRERLRRLLLGGVPAGSGLCTLATDPRQLSEMIEVAGPIVAWI
jgi:Thiamine pyrophosphate enzyme, central domain